MQLGKLRCFREGNVETFQYFECMESVLGLVTGQVIMMLPVLEQLFVLFFCPGKSDIFILELSSHSLARELRGNQNLVGKSVIIASGSIDNFPDCDRTFFRVLPAIKGTRLIAFSFSCLHQVRLMPQTGLLASLIDNNNTGTL